MTIDFVSKISPEDFAATYLRGNRPAVVKDALVDWKVGELWTPDYLKRHFGKEPVQVYNSYFDLQSMMRLERYLNEHFGGAGHAGAKDAPYVRWYTKFREVEFYWADGVFERMRPNWSRPYFLPTEGYALPFAPARSLDPTADQHPARGLFISKRGARTGLHVDPWGSDAVLCQLYGTKTWLMYSPDQAAYLVSDGAVVDPDRPDHAKFPRFAGIAPAYEFTVGPGDSVYVPHGWYHHVRSDSDAISLTWNFVHRETAPAFLDWLSSEQSEIDQSVVRYFFRDALPAESSMADVRALVASTFA